MNCVNIKRWKSFNVPKGIYNVFFSRYEYIHARCIHMRKIVYLSISIDKHLPLYMYRYIDKDTKKYTYTHMYTHPQYTLIHKFRLTYEHKHTHA